MEFREVIRHKNFHLSILIVAVVLMLTGFLFNRVVSNLGFGFAGIYALLHLDKIKLLWHDKWMWSFLALALIPLLSDVYHEGSGFLLHKGVMKWLLVLFPAFVFSVRPSEKEIRALHWSVIIAMTISTFYSLFHYVGSPQEIVESYKVSKVLPVLALGDHIRISWMNSISILMAMHLFVHSSFLLTRIVTSFYIGMQILFLHILGAKTGLLSLYVMLFIWLLWWLPNRRKWWILISIPITFCALFLAYNTLPSFQERVNFMRYDFEHYRKGEYRPGLSDAVRVYSIKAGWEIFKENPWTGVGFTPLKDEAFAWYEKNMPAIEIPSRFIPISQVIIYMASAGFVGLLIVLWHLLFPFFNRKLRRDPWFMAFFIPLFLSFFYETHLEGQFPIFVYGFFLSWFWYLATVQKNLPEKMRFTE